MRWFWPKSLLGQILLILLAGLVVSNLVAAWIYSIDREAAVRQVGGLAAAQRIANLTRLIEDAPEEWRERIVAAVSDPGFRVSLSRQRPAIADADEANNNTATTLVITFIGPSLEFVDQN